MTGTRITESAAHATSGTAALLTGVGAVTFALFPFLIPILLLTAVFAAPLALIGLAGALVAAVVAGVALVGRAAWRGLGGRRVKPKARYPVARSM